MKKLAIVFALLLVGVLALEFGRGSERRPEADQMLDAAQRAQACFDALKRERARRGLLIDPEDDINATGMIGWRYTEITTTLGSLESKRTSTNPNMAALVVRLLREVGVERGGRVAINLSGSFPALDIAVLCAVDAMGVEGVVIPSLGASTYGATIPSFTYLDMEHFLYERGLIGHKSVAYSMGGQDDVGREMDPDTVREIQARMAALGYALIDEPDLARNLDRRMALFGEAQCLVNVGGNLLSFGSGSGLAHSPGGIIRSLPGGERADGLVQRYVRQGAPVIHLLNMKGLAADCGLPFDPTPLPAPGEGAIYVRGAYNRPLAVALLLAAALALGWGKWRRA